MSARIGAVVVAYVVYRLLAEDHLAGAALVGVGGLALAGATIDRWTLWRHERSSLLTVGTIVLGLGLTGAGFYLLAR